MQIANCRLQVVAGLLALLALWPGAAMAESEQTLSSLIDAPRASTNNALIDWWQVTRRNTKLISCYGYNNGSQAFLQFYDCSASTNGVAIPVSGFAGGLYTNAVARDVGYLERLQLTNTLGGNPAALYYAIPSDSTHFTLATTLANAIAGVTVDPQGSTAAATIFRVPVHTMAIAASDNYSTIVPVKGTAFSRGLLIAASSSATTYTPAGTNITSQISCQQEP